MLTGYLPPTSGTASIAGFDIVKDPLNARKHLATCRSTSRFTTTSA